MPGRNGPGIVALLIFVASAAFLIVWRRRAAVIPIVVLAVVLLSGARALAQEQPIVEKSVSSHDSARRPSPQMWEVELKTGFWMPQNSVLNQVFTPCCNMITRLQGGFLYKGRYGIGGGVGFLYKTANALGTGAHEGEQSSDRFSFILIPFETNFTFRAQFPQIKYVIPYARAGLDYVYFREGIHGSSTKGFKYGMHGTGGVQIDIGSIADVAFSSDEDFGINDFYLTLEGQYQWINNFGGGGLDLSGPVCSIGLLFEF
jgi:hypothetical protein